MTIDSIPALGARKAFLWVARLASYLVYFYLIVVEIILFLGFFLLLFGANAEAGFTQWVYRNLDRVMAPFRGIFTPINLGQTNGNVESVFETSVLFAMIMYGILALVLNAFISWLTHRLRKLEDAETALELRQESERRWAAEHPTAAAPGSVPVVGYQPTATGAGAVSPVPPSSVPPA